jgi:hypothetical protein
VNFASSGTLTNTGTVIGGTGGINGHFNRGMNGGVGVSLTSDGTITNTGTITGGTGGRALGGSGTGGPVFISMAGR